MLPEFTGEVFKYWVPLGQQQRDRKHASRERRHPARAVGLSEHVTGWQLAAIERAAVVHSQEAAVKNILSKCISPVDPPREIEQQFFEDSLQECVVGGTR